MIFKLLPISRVTRCSNGSGKCVGEKRFLPFHSFCLLLATWGGGLIPWSFSNSYWRHFVTSLLLVKLKLGNEFSKSDAADTLTQWTLLSVAPFLELGFFLMGFGSGQGDTLGQRSNFDRSREVPRTSSGFPTNYCIFIIYLNHFPL